MEDELKKRIINGIKFFKVMGNKYDSEMAKKYFPAFLLLLEQYFGIEEEDIFETAKKIFGEEVKQ